MSANPSYSDYLAAMPEIAQKLSIYNSLLRKWQKTINLVGPSTLNDIPLNHFHNSFQLINYIPDKGITLVDMGSGAGFPGMVLAILGVKNVHLIESDTRKAVFLQNVSRETMTPVTVHNLRIEDCKIPNIDLITARALAPLKDLLHLAHTLDPQGRATCLFLKGEKAESEIQEAREMWDFSVDVYDGLGKIVKLFHVKQFET